MEKLDGSILTTLQRAQRFIENHAEALGAIAASGTRRRFDDAIATISQATIDQEATKRLAMAATAKQRVLRNTLMLGHMRPIAAIAAADLRDAVECKALQVPPARTTSRHMIIAARAMADAAEPHVAVFVDGGLGVDFIAQLRAAADALDAALVERGHLVTELVGATARIKTTVSRARELLRVLDSLIQPLLAGDPSALVEWKSARQFEGRVTGAPETLTDTAVIQPPVLIATTRPVAVPA